ncbi:hypothetical protein [Rhizobium rhizoryzae]|uniref:Uncharacterized protein n=1 Tax=Rhizobium rhizoryzae TaxID=451876 RepID=A0A7W6LMY6_9HYPH|nr:hypothetical protein [Rhizobium rhizoryzae]MBB4146051.1 hypothetical protein [Rhizobium rhizoryzae]
MNALSQSKPQSKLFQVVFIGGTSVTVGAENSLKAQQKAIRSNPGMIKQVKILRGAAR